MTQDYRLSLLIARLRTIGILYAGRKDSPQKYSAQIALLENRCIKDLARVPFSRNLLEKICESYSLALFDEISRLHPEALAREVSAAIPFVSEPLFEKAPYPLVAAALRAGMALPSERHLIERVLVDDDASALSQILAQIYPKPNGDQTPHIEGDLLLGQFCRLCKSNCAPIVASWFENCLSKKGPDPLLEAAERRLSRRDNSGTLKIIAVLATLGIDLTGLPRPSTPIPSCLAPFIKQTGSNHGRLAMRAVGVENVLSTPHRSEFFGLIETKKDGILPAPARDTSTGSSS